MKLLLMFLVSILSFNIIAMDYYPPSDGEEIPIDSDAANIVATIIINGDLEKQNPNDAQQNKVLRCCCCGKKLLFQNQLDLEIAENNILCSVCEKEIKKRRLTRSK